MRVLSPVHTLDWPVYLPPPTHTQPSVCNPAAAAEQRHVLPPNDTKEEPLPANGGRPNQRQSLHADTEEELKGGRRDAQCMCV